MFNFWVELEKFIHNCYNCYSEEERNDLWFEARSGTTRIPYSIANCIFNDWKEWTARESDFVEHFNKLEDYNRLLREENQRLRKGAQNG